MHPPPRLFGRTGELELLGRLIADVRRGRSAVLVVRGEPGIGKTELLRHLIAEASGFGVTRVAGIGPALHSNRGDDAAYHGRAEPERPAVFAWPGMSAHFGLPARHH
jgi:AAA ATPase domain